jgi:hypothetical protein
MIDHSLFYNASRKKFRFSSDKGDLTTEQLWDLPLTGKCSLNSVAVGINRLLKETGEESFVEDTSNPAQARLREQLEVVKTVIAVRQQENREKMEVLARKETRDKIQRILAEKKDAALSDLSVEELEKQLAALR